MELKLIRLKMWNFRGEVHRVTNFNQEGITSISGRNGLGKSRHMDAFFWCLFGKDSQERKDFEIKSRCKGETINKADAVVELTINVGGVDTTFTRSLVERWERPKGQEEEVFKGNKTECKIDNVPVTVAEYQSRVEYFFGSSTKLKSIINPSYFAEVMTWQERRAVLLEMSGITTEDIIKQDSDFKELIMAMDGRNDEGYKRYLLAQEKPLKSKPEEIDIRIKLLQEIMPEEVETPELLTRELAKEGAIVQNLMSKKASIEGDKVAMISGLKAELAEIRRKADEISHQQDLEYKNILNSIKADIKDAEYAKKMIIAEQMSKYESAQKISQYITEAELRKSALASQYKEARLNTSCPTCGAEMSEEKVAEFLKPIEAEGLAERDKIIKYKLELKELLDATEELASKADEKQESIKKLNKTLEDAISDVPAFAATVEEVKRIHDLEEQIESLENGDTTKQLEYINTEIDKHKEIVTGIVGKIAKNHDREDILKRIEKLNNEKVSVSVALARLQRYEMLLNKFQIVRAKMIQDRVDSIFEGVKFQMFTKTIDGNLIECCSPIINDALYGSANTASRLNIGLEIISKLCDFYNIYAPIWIDNAECCNDIKETQSQQVRLYVTEENVLTIK